uniref:UDP-glycosyltransferase 89A2-like n=1 Tax=Erigeron canadensis TaxID=72917 RepID=UPI001CB96345|nr:UDP-glycosyltransferase 89A2-like [Erigeron canadensis]
MGSIMKGAHILIFPFPAQGHMLPLLDLTHHLATHGLTITILVTPKNLPILNPLLASCPNIQPLVFPFPDHPSLPKGVENVKDIGNHGNLHIINSLAKLQETIIQWFNSHPSPPVAMISDFFLGWTQHLANKLGIPRVGFFSSGAFLTAVLDYVCHNIKLVQSQDVTVFHDLPNGPALKWEELPTLARVYKESDPEWELVLDGHIVGRSSWGSIVNTFYGLETQYMEYLTKIMGHGRVFGVGPVSLLNGSDPMTRGKSESGSDYDVLRWLDSRPDGSVLYVCFGSQKFLSKAQMEALAIGLEESGVHYVWVVKQELGDPVVSGSGRGMVINGWAPQVSILGHQAVAGFLSHCGWNSVLEAIVGGVKILAWPMEADQYVNARLLVDDHGAAVRVCEGANTVPDSAELARKIGESMSGSENNKKMRAKELKDKAIEAVKEGGSSFMELDRLVNALSNLEQKLDVPH